MKRKNTASQLSIIKKCPGCKPHKYQDEVYGYSVRMMNQLAPKQGRNLEYRCSICERVTT